MVEKSINRLQFLCSTIPSLLAEIDEQHFNEKIRPEKWSKKEIIGHLIDSAANNHQRFIRGQFEDCPEIRYDQNKWNEYNFYQQIDSKQIIEFWKVYNLQLIEIMKRIPSENLVKQIRIGENLVTLEFLIIDYVEHLEHHLQQVINY